MEYSRQPQKFTCLGLQLSRPADLIAEGKYRRLTNVRSQEDGVLETRPGCTEINSSAIPETNVHSVKRLNNDHPAAPVDWARVVGAGTKLYTGKDSFTERDTGYSGDPLSIITFRPDQSPEPWAWIADSQKLRKIKADGTDYGVGILPPTVAPSAELAIMNYTTIHECDSLTNWAAGGTASGLNNAVRTAATTTIGAILYDSGSTGWACVVPSNASNNHSYLGLGLKIFVGTEQTIVEEVHPKLVSSVPVTVSSILYDSGSSGLCTIQLSSALTGLARNSVLYLNSSEYIRVLSVTPGPDGISSIRCSTTGTISIGHSVVSVWSFRGWLGNTQTVGATIYAAYMLASVAVGTGYADYTASLDLSVIQITGNRPAQPEDYIHISVRCSDPSKVLEGRIAFDVDAATNDFTKNFYYATFRPSDLTASTTSVLSLLTTRGRTIQRTLIEQYQIKQQKGEPTAELPELPEDPVQPELPPDPMDPDAVSQQTVTGASQWAEVFIRVSDFIRVGADTTRGWANIAKFRIQITTTATVNLDWDSIWIGGGYGPNAISAPLPYQYRFRYRNKETGAISMPGPATRFGLNPRRQRITITTTGSADTQVDLIDIERFGGSVNRWAYLATVPNGTSTYNDDIQDLALLSLLALQTDCYPPFTVIDSYKTGTCDVAGTRVKDIAGADGFDTAWPPGVEITIDGTPYTIYRVISSSELETVENVGAKSAVTWIIDEPLRMQTPLPIWFGPFNGHFLAMGDPRNAGTLYYTEANNPDSAPLTHRLELCSPSEKLMNGCLTNDGRAIVFSTERAWEIRPDYSSPNLLVAQDLPVGCGLNYPWAIATDGKLVFFLGRDGIYMTNGGPAASITDQDLFPLFPHEGKAAYAVEGYNPPKLTTSTKPRLACADKWLFFEHTDSGDFIRTFSFYIPDQSWYFDTYSHAGINLHYMEEVQKQQSLILCANNGKLYSAGGLTDAGSNIVCEVRTASFDQGEIRADKLYGDVVAELNSGGNNVSTTTGFDLFTFTEGFTLNTSTRTQSTLNINSGLGTEARNLGFNFAWTTSTLVQLFALDFSFIVRPEWSDKRATDWSNWGHPGDKQVFGLLLEADTEGIAKTIQVQTDGGTVVDTLTVNHSGRLQQPYSFTVPPFFAHLLRLVPTTTGNIRIFREGCRFVFVQKPELAQWYTDWSDEGTPGDKEVYGLILEADTSGVAGTVQVQRDGGTVAATLSVNHATQSQKPYAFSSPVTAAMLRLAPVSSNVRIFRSGTKFLFKPIPEKAALVTSWTDGGRKGAKWLQGCRITANTDGVDVPFTIQYYDDDKALQTISLTANHPAELTLPYDWTPVIAHEMRIIPSAAMRLFFVEWVWEPAPDLAYLWKTPPMAHGQGFGHLRDAYIAFSGVSSITLYVIADGTTYTYPVTNPQGSSYGRPRVIFQPMKAKSYQYLLSANTKFRVYKQDCEVRFKPWGDPGPYRTLSPFGDLSVESGARI